MPSADQRELWHSLQMDVSWANQSDPGNIVAPKGDRRADSARASVLYQPVNVGGEDIDVLVAQALDRYENTLMIELRADYYENANVNAWPDRLFKRFRLVRGYLP